MTKQRTAGLSCLCLLLLQWFSISAYGQHTEQEADRYLREMMPRTLERLAQYKEEARTNPPQEELVFFLGSATTAGWDLDRWFPEYETVKRGFGGTMIDENLQLAKEVVIPYKPSTIVLYAGENDTWLGKPPELTLQHFKELVATLKSEIPNTQLIYVTMKPSIRWWSKVDEMRKANQLIEDYIATENHVYYVDTFTSMLDQHGNPRRDYLGSDDLHLTDLGFEVWSNAVRPVIKAAETNYRLLTR